MNFGENRVFDTGIRETTIIGKGIGLALRGFDLLQKFNI